MSISQKSLNKVFLFGVFGLYAFGVVTNFHIKTKGEYIRYLTRAVDEMRLNVVSQSKVFDQYNSLSATNSVYTNENGDDVVPYISYSISHNAKSYYSVGEVHFCFIEENFLDQHFNDVYLDYYGSYVSYSKSYMDVGDFQYNSDYYNLLEFLTTLSSDSVYSYSTLYQYGYGGFINYNYQNKTLNVGLNFVFKVPSSNSWTTCSLFNTTYNNVTYLDEDVSYSFTNYTYLNSVLSANLNYSNNYINSYQNGVNDVINNPSDYDLYTLNEYLSYGNSKYNEGLEAGTNALSLSGVLNSIFSAPITMFMQIFNSAPFVWTMPTGEVLDLGGLMTFLLTIGIALAIVRLIMKVGGK